MATGARVTGLREVVRDLERLGVDVADLKEAFGDVARDVAADARSLVHVVTGALQGTIRPAKSKNKAVVRAGNGTRVQYAREQDNANSFLTGPANNDTAGKVAKVEHNLQELIRKRNLNR